jgi:hypothetical protein
MFYDKITISALVISGLFLLIGFSVAFVKLAQIDHLLIIHFDSFQGIDFLGGKSHVYGILASGLFLNLLNVFLAGAFYPSQRFLAYLLVFFNILLSLLIMLIMFVIVSVN